MKHIDAENGKRKVPKSRGILFKEASLPRRLVSFVLACSMMFFNVAPVFATNITDVQGNNGVYNINAAKVSGSTGFRHYKDFSLDNGHVANLKFDQGYNKFVNLVDKQVNINGIVNSVKNNAFYNGHAIFVSPNGIVVGASGVLNVGSLTIATPSSGKYNDLRSAYTDNSLGDYEHGAEKYNELINDSRGTITINGKIIAKENVELYGKEINIVGGSAGRAGIVAGVKNQGKITTQQQAKEVFDSLVQNNIVEADNFSLEDGKIKIVAARKSGFSDDNEDYHLKTNVDIVKADLGANEVDISATSEVDRQEKIDLAEAKVDITDSAITGETISVVAKATQNKKFNMANPLDDLEFIANTLYDFLMTPSSDNASLTSLWGVAGKAEAEVNVDNSTITALGATAENAANPNMSVIIRAEASSDTMENANFLTPTIIDFIFNEDSHIGEYFSSDIYNGFEGARSSAIVYVEDSAIRAVGENAGNIEISSEASSSLDANNKLLAFALPVGIYGVGTETVSKVLVKDSVLTALNGDIDVTAVSENESSTVITSDSTFSIKLEEGFFLIFLNNTVKTDTEASITNTNVDTENLTVFATNLSDSYAEISMEAVAGEKDKNDPESTGNSAASGGVILNRSNNRVTALIKDSKVNAKEDVTVLAQGLHATENAPDGSVDDKMVQKPKTFDAEMNKTLKDLQGKFFKFNIFDKIRGKTPVAGKEGENADIEFGGAVVHNVTNNFTTATIENTELDTDGDVTVSANAVDLLTNTATSDTQGEAKFGVSVAVIISEQNNTTKALIDNSKVEADNVTVDATTELPMNVGSLTFGMKFPFKIMGMDSFMVGGKFASEANGKWDVSPTTPKTDDDAPVFEFSGLAEQNIIANYNNLKPKFRLSGFFNNLAQTNSVGGTASASAAVVYNEVNTDTLAAIQNGSNVTAYGDDVVVNAVDSVIGYNGAGLVDILIKTINYKLPGQQDWEYEPTVDGGKVGIGANFIFDNYTNNATAIIDNSTVIAEDGSIKVNSATEQSYMNIILTGGKSEGLGVDGSVHIQKINGDTIARISNLTGDNTIVAEDIGVYAGKATIRTTGGKIARDDDTNEIKWKVQNGEAQGDEKYIREAKDEITNIIVQGALAQQTEEVEQGEQSSSGVAVGASVNVTLIDRNVKATIEDANAEATNLEVEASTYNQKIDVEGAAAFSGGVNQKQEDAGDLQENIDDAQNKEDNKSFNDSISSVDDDDAKNNNDIILNLLDNKKDDGDGDDDEDFVIDIGEIQDQFSLSVAGAVDIAKDDTNVEASIKNTELSVEEELSVNASREAKNILFGGAVGKSQKNGAGAAVSYNKQDGSVKSIINNSNIEFSGENPELTVGADNKNWMLNISIGAGASVNSDASNYGFQSAVGGSLNINTLNPEITAAIENSHVGAEDEANKINVDISAKNKVDIYNIAGGGAYLSGNNKNGVGAGAAVNYNNVKNSISAYVANSTLDNIDGLVILADADNDISDFAVAGSLVTGSDSGWAFDGSANINYIHDTVKSRIIGSTITAEGDIEVKANTNSDTLDVAGTLNILMSDEGGAGVNGDIVVNVFKNDVTAEIGDSYKFGADLVPVTERRTDIISANDVKVAATSTEKMNNIMAGAAVSTGGTYLMAAANVNVDVIDNDVKSYVSGDLGIGSVSDSINGLTVAAYDETTIYTRGGTFSAAISEEAKTLIAGTVNVDKISKDVVAKIFDSEIKAKGDVTASAVSFNSLGGTKGDDNKYSRDDVTSEEYREKLLHKGTDGQYDGLQLKTDEGGNDYIALEQDSDFINWNMAFDIAAGSNLAVAGAGIGIVIENTVTAEISNSAISADNLYVLADDYSIKNIIAGTIGGSLKIGSGLSVLYTRDNSTTSALIDNGSELNILQALTVDAANRKDNHQILIAGSGAAKGAIAANIAINDVEDKVYAKIGNEAKGNVIYAGEVKVTANEDLNASHIVVSGGIAPNAAVDVNPIVNTYDQTVESAVQYSSIRDASIDMDAISNINSLDVAVGIAGVAQGAAGVGVAIKNDYTGNIKSYIDNAMIETDGNLDIDADSTINSTNWIVAGGVTMQGAAIVANVLLNEIDTTVEAGIKKTDIEESGAIAIATNDGKSDYFDNNAIAIGAAMQGLDAIVSVIKNDYANTVVSYIDNAESYQIDSIDISSNSERHIQNNDIGVSFTGQGASLAANAVVNDINSTTRSYVDSKAKKLNVIHDMNIISDDLTATRNSVIMGAGAGVGAAVGLNVNLYTANNLVEAELLSDAKGQINAGSANLASHLTNALDNTQANVSIGLAAVPIDVQIVKIGQKTNTYSNAEQISDMKKYVDSASSKIPQGLSTPTTSSSALKTGAVSSIDGNVNVQGDVIVNANSALKGLTKETIDGVDIDKLTDTLELNTYRLAGGLGSLSAAVRDVQVANNTLAEIAGGNVASANGDVKTLASSAVNVSMPNINVEVSGAQISGGSDIYENSSETLSQIKDATIKANNVAVDSNSRSHALLDAVHVAVAVGGIVNVDLVEAKDTNKAVSLITGNTSIDAIGKLSLHSTVDTDLQSIKLSVPVQGASIVSVMKNDATANTISKAVIENVNGAIKTNGLDIITDYTNMSVTARSNIVSVKGISLVEYNDSGAFMNAYFRSGIDSLDGLALVNTGTTNIITARGIGQDTDILAYGRTHDVSVQGLGIYTGTFANAQNEATSSTVLKAKNHTSKALKIEQYLNTKAKADANGTKVTAAGVYAVAAEAEDTSKMLLDVDGSNTILNRADIKARHNATTEADLKAFNLGFLVAGSRLRLESNMEADTIMSIGGNFNVGDSLASIEILTSRNASLDKTSGTGGFINVADTGVANTLKGQSILNLSGLNTDAEYKNRMFILNDSANTYKVKTTDEAGGFINVSDTSATSSFNTTTEVNIEDSDINSSSNFNVTVNDSTSVEDNSSAEGGGFISYVNGSANNSYASNAKINIKSSNINAEDVNLKTLSSVVAYPYDIHYTGVSGGIVAFDYIDVANTITNTSEIGFQSSMLEASHNALLEATSSSYFKQKIESGAYGLASKASGISHLNVVDNNKIAVDDKSKVSALNELEINFSSANTLLSSVSSDVTNFAGEPVAKSYIDLSINNTLENSGSLLSGNMLDINFMPGSYNYLTQYAKSVSTAAIASTTEDGKLTKKVNNKIDNKASGEMASGKDIDINYTTGGGETNSTIYWETKSVWGLITDSGSSSKYDVQRDYTLNNDGRIVAAQNNSKYMKINRDGTIDKASLKSFYDDDYILSDGEIIDGAKLKEQVLAKLDIELDNVDGDIEEYQTTITNYEAIITDLAIQKAETEAALGELESLIENGAVLLESKSSSGSGIYYGVSDFDLKMQKDSGIIRYTDTDPARNQKITQAQYDTMMGDFLAALQENENLTMAVFLNEKKPAYGFTDAQVGNIVNGYADIQSRLSTTAHGYVKYIGKDNVTYIAALNPTGEGTSQSCKNIDKLHDRITDIENEMDRVANIKENGAELVATLQSQKGELLAQYNGVYETPASEYDYKNGDYSIVFKDIVINPSSGRITISGLTNASISGRGTVEIAKAGLQIDNYSTRSLVFNDVMVNDAAVVGGFVLNGKSQAEFANKNQAISGLKAYEYFYPNALSGQNNKPSFDSLPTSGVHYVTRDTGITGTTINNYYDTNHPLADTLDIQNPTKASDITIYGDVDTTSLSIFNASGNIVLDNTDANSKGIDTDSLNLYAMNGQVDVIAHNSAGNNKVTIRPTDRIFAANGLNVEADEVDITGNVAPANIKTGYSVRGITITDAMLKDENLIVDPTTGEKNLINLKDDIVASAFRDDYSQGNIKAIYKDGKIYLYDLPQLKKDNGVNIVAGKGKVAPNAVVSTGNQSFTINNTTNKELVVGDIDNSAFNGNYSVSGGAVKGVKPEIHEVLYAQSNITSNGKVSVNGKVVNGLDQDGNPVDKSKLSINAKDDLDIAKHQTYDSIIVGGTMELANADNGTLNVFGTIINKKGYTSLYGSDGIAIYGKVYSVDGDVEMTAPKGNLTIAKGAQVHVDKGDLILHQKDVLGNLDMNGQIIVRDGNIMTESLGNETDNGLLFTDEFMDENDLDDIMEDLNKLSVVDIDYELNGKMDYGYDVTGDEDLKSNGKILRLHRNGATIVNEGNLKVGDKLSMTIKFAGVDVTVQCKVLKVEGNVALVKFSNLPQSVGNKISERYMRKGLFHDN